MPCTATDSCPVNNQCLVPNTSVCTVCDETTLNACNCTGLTNCASCPTTEGKSLKCAKCLEEKLGDDCSCNSGVTNCATCITDGTACKTCANGHFTPAPGCAREGETAVTCSACSPNQSEACICGGITTGDCGTCTANGSACETCKKGFYVVDNAGAKTCTACGAGCLECSAAATCTKCEDGKFANPTGNGCTACSEANSENKKCFCGGDISGNCKTCSGTGNQCTDCFGTMQIESGLCKEPQVTSCNPGSCDAGNYCDTDNTCKSCGSTLNCKTCLKGEKCDTCKDNFFPTPIGAKAGVTCEACVSGTTANCECGDIKNCTSCDIATPATPVCSKCAENFTGDNCDKCADGYFDDKTTAKDTPATLQCTKCLTNCATCSNSTTCNSCKPGLIGSDCSCNATKTASLNCSTCIDGGEVCKDCTGNFAPVNITGKSTGVTCDTCITGFTGTNCDECADNYAPVIATPEFKTALECSQCIEGKTTNCKCGTIENCSKCNIDNPTTPVCGKCVGNFTEASKCTTCKEGFKGDTCEDCAEGYYDATPAPSKAGKTCSKCLDVCLTCSNGTTCDTCKSDLVGPDCSCKQSEATSTCLTCIEGGDVCKTCHVNHFPKEISEKSGVTCELCVEGVTTNCSCGDIKNCSVCFEPEPEIPAQLTTTGCFKCAPGYSGDECVKDKEEKKGLSGGAIAGIIIGVIVVVGGVAGGVFYYMKKVKGGKSVSSSSAAMQ